MVKIEIDVEKCIGCGACVNACPASLFKLVDEKSKVVGNVDDCILCRACETSCSAGVITICE